jgi:hypothetical protein
MSRSPIIEALKAINTAMLRDAKYTIENGTLCKAGIYDVNGVACVEAVVHFPGGGGATLGGLTCGQFNPDYLTFRGTRYGMEALLWLMAVAGVERSDDLGGQYVRVAFDEAGKAQYIGHIVRDIWLNFETLAKGLHDEEPAKKED